MTRHAARCLACLGWLVATCGVSACGVQATWASRARAPHFQSFDVGGRIVGTRADGAYAGGDLVLGVPRSGTFGARHVLATGGYRFLGPVLSLELGADLGVGQPAQRAWNGTGMYVGASSALLFRLVGNQDVETGYSPLGLLTDLVLVGRAGMWSPTWGDSRAELGDAAIQIGFRFTAISDIPVSSNRNWHP